MQASLPCVFSRYLPPLTAGFFFPRLFGVFLGVVVGLCTGVLAGVESFLVAAGGGVAGTAGEEDGFGDVGIAGSEGGGAAALDFVGEASASGAGVGSRDGGEEVMGRGARGAVVLEGEGEEGEAREVEGTGVVPAAGRGFDGARVKEEGVR